jgi:hypothetical protein
MKGLKSPALRGEGRGAYGKARLDREDVILANVLFRPPIPKDLLFE